MDHREPTMYAEKRYELAQMKDRLMAEFQNSPYPNPAFQHQVFWELGETKTLLLIFEQHVHRGRFHEAVNTVILLTEYQNFQGADLIVTRGYTDDMVDMGVQALRNLGFHQKT